MLFTGRVDTERQSHLPWIACGMEMYYDPSIPSVYEAKHKEEGQLILGHIGKALNAPARCLIDLG